MKIYLARHGQYNSADVDPLKGLSDTGKAEIGRLAEALRGLDINVAIIWHSGKARAEETAQILAAAVKSANGLIKQTGLNPDDPVDDVATEIQTLDRNLMIVGHLPFMAKLTAKLLTGDSARCAVNFPTGSIICLDYNRGKWSLDWFINPQVIAGDQGPSFRSYH
jgi:phosphohistidine phosphatase